MARAQDLRPTLPGLGPLPAWELVSHGHWPAWSFLLLPFAQASWPVWRSSPALAPLLVSRGLWWGGSRLPVSWPSCLSQGLCEWSRPHLPPPPSQVSSQGPCQGDTDAGEMVTVAKVLPAPSVALVTEAAECRGESLGTAAGSGVQIRPHTLAPALHSRTAEHLTPGFRAPGAQQVLPTWASQVWIPVPFCGQVSLRDLLPV